MSEKLTDEQIKKIGENVTRKRILSKAIGIAIGEYPWEKEHVDVKRLDGVAAKMAAVTGGHRYTGYYLRNVYMHKQPMTEALYSLCRQFIEVSEREANGTANLPKRTLRVPEWLDDHVVDDSVVLRGSRLCPCGTWFIPVVGNQIYHTPHCRMYKK